MNVVYVPNYNFVENALEIFNPRNSMMISRNTGEVSTQTLPIKDTITNANNLLNLGRKWYSNDEKNSIELLDKSQAVNIHDNIVNIENINVVGFGGSNPTPFDTLNEYEDELLYKELSKYDDVLSSDSFTILVTHAPPINTKADKIEGDIHVGSEGIRKIVEQTQPTLNICGHVHEAVAIDKIGNTTIVNPGDAQAGHACMLELSEENITEKEVNVTLIEL